MMLMLLFFSLGVMMPSVPSDEVALKLAVLGMDTFVCQV